LAARKNQLKVTAAKNKKFLIFVGFFGENKEKPMKIRVIFGFFSFDGQMP
jgi:hypothetical protein